MTQIDYNLRPAKHIERVMLSQALRRLRPFAAVETYRYVGFGALYYRDFRLFHRDLGITDMLSIEMDTMSQARYQANAPYSCVTTVFGFSTDVLPTLDWSPRTIAWLDYTAKLDQNVLADLSFFAANCVPGSVLIATVNVQADRLNQQPLALLEERVGAENVPEGVTDADLTGWKLSTMSRRIMANKIADALAARNGPRPPAARLVFRCLFNFEYADDAKMLTFGGLFYEQGQEPLAASCRLEDLTFVRDATTSFRIEVPKLT